MPTEDEIADWRISGRGVTIERELELLRKIEVLVIERDRLRLKIDELEAIMRGEDDGREYQATQIK